MIATGISNTQLYKQAGNGIVVNVLEAIFKHTTTLGVRQNISQRYALDRTIETVQTNFGPVRIKKAEGFGVERQKYEYEDLARIARETGLPLDLADRITGADDDAMRADAESLAKLLKTQQAPAPIYRPSGEGANDGKDSALKGLVQSIRGN